MIKGLYDYFSSLIYEYEKIMDEGIIDHLTHSILKENKKFSLEDLEDRRKSDISGEKFFECGMSSLHTKKFMKII